LISEPDGVANPRRVLISKEDWKNKKKEPVESANQEKQRQTSAPDSQQVPNKEPNEEGSKNTGNDTINMSWEAMKTEDEPSVTPLSQDVPRSPKNWDPWENPPKVVVVPEEDQVIIPYGPGESSSDNNMYSSLKDKVADDNQYYIKEEDKPTQSEKAPKKPEDSTDHEEP
jgi:hypothetical protein